MLHKPSKSNKLLLVHLLMTMLTIISPLIIFGQEKINYKIISAVNVKSVPNRSGSYIIRGKNPSQFSNFSSFIIEYIEIRKNTEDIKLVGAVNVYQTSSELTSLYQFTEISFPDNKLSFKTEEIKDIRYEFEGVYLKKGDLVSFNRKKIAVLEGTLIRFVKGKKDAEAKMRLSFAIWEAPYYLPSK